MNERLQAIAEAIETGAGGQAVALVSEALLAGSPAQVVLNDGLVAGLREIGRLFEAGEAFLPELLVSAEAMNRASQVLEPALLVGGFQARGCIVIGTMKGDLHDIGKNLVAMMLRGNGFEVHDLGVDVDPDAFMEAVADHKPDIVAMSALLSTTAPRFADVITCVRAHCEQKIRFVVGGAPVTPAFAEQVGADGYACDCVAAVAEVCRLMGGCE